MKIVVLDGYTLNPGNLSRQSSENLGKCKIYNRTSLTDEEEIIKRIGDSEIVFTWRTFENFRLQTLLHCPLFPSTKVICAENISKMKNGVIILNNSRGSLIVKKDLRETLDSGKVFAAGLDVVSTEPIKADNPLLGAKNCIITPHFSWAPKESRERLMNIAVENLKNFLAENPVNVVNL